MKKLTLQQFIEKSKIIHGDKYDYSLVEYKNNRTKITIICKQHGKFTQNPDGHLEGRGCRLCKNEKLSQINTNTQDYVIQKMKNINGDEYDYSLVEYTGYHNLVKIICKKHNNIFLQSPANHCHPFIGCDMCKKENSFYTTDMFIQKAKEKHGEKYDYVLVNYVNSRSKVNIICKKHGIFKQMPVSHLEGKGCKSCKSSRGELSIEKILLKNNISFIREFSFDKCRSPKNKKLKFDFYLTDYNSCIEYDGEQHFIVKQKWDGVAGLEYTKNHDNIKTQFCKNNNIKLYRITYKDDIVVEMKKIIDSLLRNQTSCNSV